MCELTNQSRLSIQEADLKETGAQTESFRGRIQSCSTAQYEETDVFLSIRACQRILVVTQNIIMNLNHNLDQKSTGILAALQGCI